MAQIKQDKEVRKAGALARRFARMAQANGIGHRRAAAIRLTAFARWIRQAKTCGIPALESFATNLQEDATSVRAALTTRRSDGQTEGHVSKLKLLKRSMCGRAKFDLLRRRLLLTS